ncbi:MAG: amidase [Mycobacteriales bacterium]
MSTWIWRGEPGVTGQVRLAVKDAIDVAGVPTTAGSASVADDARPAAADAACLAGARTAGAALVGKTNLHELCFGTSGANLWFGTPRNPVAPDRVPGGSSSGSAVAVADGEADVAYGTDSGGSVRIPAACCGVVGLKTTWGRVPTGGVWPLAPDLDTVGPLARNVAGVARGMALLEPGFRPGAPAARLGRLRLRGAVDPDLDQAVDRLVAACGLEVTDVALTGAEDIADAFAILIMAGAWAANRHLVEGRPERIEPVLLEALRRCAGVTPDQVAKATAVQALWQDSVRSAFEHVDLFVLPTLRGQPPLLGKRGVDNGLVHPWNVARTPALAIPLPVPGWPMPGSVQLVGPWGSEERLCGTGRVFELAAAG